MTKAELYKKACMLPLLPGVYIIRDKTDTIIYIGKAKRLKIRVSQYFREGVPHDAKVTQMINHAFTFDVIVCQSEFEALVLEASQIKAHTPKYNILLKDDKGYSYVKITRGPWPRVSAALQKDDDDADYIGPFTSSFAVREMVEISHSAEEASQLSRKKLTDRERAETIARLEKEMKEASRMLEFEYAALLRDQIIELRGQK